MQDWERKFKKVHPVLARRPTLPQGLIWLHNAFMELECRRGYDSYGSPRHLDIHEMETYGRLVVGVQEEGMPAFISAMLELDGAVMADIIQRMSKKDDKTGQKQAP